MQNIISIVYTTTIDSENFVNIVNRKHKLHLFEDESLYFVV